MAECNKIRGTVVLLRKNLSVLNDASLVGKEVCLRLISADAACKANESPGKPAYLEEWSSSKHIGESSFKVTFDWDEKFGVPGAFVIQNNDQNEFYLKTVTFEDVPGDGRIHFVCNSWVYPMERYKNDRVFFTNKTYLPSETPKPLRYYREQELRILRGDGKGGLQEWDRVYDYDYYNNLGNPDKDHKYARKILGGSVDYPYPRRARTGLPPTESDPDSESRLPFLMSLNIYVPRDERFGQLKMSDFLAYTMKSIFQYLKSSLEAIGGTPNEFDSFQDVLKLYEGGADLPDIALLSYIRKIIPLELLKEIYRTDCAQFFEFPKPQVIKENKSAWRSDEEFAREMLAGVNPVIIRRLEEFPPASKLDSKLYGDQNSTITAKHIESNLDGLTVDKAIEKNKLFILDHHDALMPYLRSINTTTFTKTYASRTILFLKDDGL
ncbi:hypothetical protein Dsin_021231 [Dipteronia sinensis]|uniref:Lipoxygenase n=1 Tax=Dipteronia sinensis TaxID=43782 RepID=A0AAE0DYT1_9ROSI|nr:hypothetical protein Dsin_021231 [Dipteronia sinensis]